MSLCHDRLLARIRVDSPHRHPYDSSPLMMHNFDLAAVETVSVLGTALMARKLRIAAICTSLTAAVLILVVGGAYYATRQVRPFYEQALRLEPEAAQRGSRELESRATALYSDARQAGQWHAVFTAEQINGWLAVQLDKNQARDEDKADANDIGDGNPVGEVSHGDDQNEGRNDENQGSNNDQDSADEQRGDEDQQSDENQARDENDGNDDKDQKRDMPKKIRDPRIAISPDMLTLGFRTKSGGLETVISVDASVFLMEDGAVGIRFLSVRAGSLPLPVMQLADDIAKACQQLPKPLPVRWTQQDGQPVAIVEIHSDESSDRHFFIDSIELGEGELYLAGHTEVGNSNGRRSPKITAQRKSTGNEIALDDYELRLTPSDRRSALEVARRATRSRAKNEPTPGR